MEEKGSKHQRLKSISDAFGEYAKEYSEKFNDVSEYYEALDLVVAKLGPTDRLLDLACGPANLSGYIVGKRADIDITLADASQSMLELAAQLIPEAKVLQCDIRDLKIENGLFNAIVFGFGLPYLNLTETKQCIKYCRGILDLGGLFYISFMEGLYEESRIIYSSNGRHGLMTYFYSESQIRLLLEDEGFIIIYTDRLKRESSCDIVIVAKRKLV